MREVLLVLVILISLQVRGVVYFSLDSETSTDGTVVPNPPLCGWECSGSGDTGTRAYYGSAGGAPQGSKYFYWNIVQNQHDHYNEIRQPPGLPMSGNKSGQIFYLAYFFRFERKTGGNRFDIFQSGQGVQSAEKGIEVRGEGLRWTTAMGQWDSLAPNQAGRFTIWTGNPSFHLNPSLEHNDVYYPNQSGFSSSSSLQLEYEKWHRVVFAIRLSTTNTGSVALWVNGIKTVDYQNIPTVAPGITSPNIGYLELGGTLCQPAYDCPPHTRKYDAMLLTDSWQDIINGGYLSSTNTSPTISSPKNLRVASI